MQTRSDLLAVAARLAAQAHKDIVPRREAGDGIDEVPGDLGAAANMAYGAKVALEAAALVDADPAPIVAALERFADTVEATDVADALTVSLPDALDLAGAWVAQAQRASAVAATVHQGYASLRELLEGLARDFDASDTPTAQRIAARIHKGLDVAAEAITAATNQLQEG